MLDPLSKLKATTQCRKFSCCFSVHHLILQGRLVWLLTISLGVATPHITPANHFSVVFFSFLFFLSFFFSFSTQTCQTSLAESRSHSQLLSTCRVDFVHLVTRENGCNPIILLRTNPLFVKLFLPINDHSCTKSSFFTIKSSFQQKIWRQTHLNFLKYL